jgi:hypothetical protein
MSHGLASRPLLLQMRIHLSTTAPQNPLASQSATPVSGIAGDQSGHYDPAARRRVLTADCEATTGILRFRWSYAGEVVRGAAWWTAIPSFGIGPSLLALALAVWLTLLDIAELAAVQ